MAFSGTLLLLLQAMAVATVMHPTEANTNVWEAPTEAAALLDFKEALGHPAALFSWTGTAPCRDNWLGVTCQKRTSRKISTGHVNNYLVTDINLQYLGLSGELRQSLLSISTLQNLNLRGNKLTGIVPSFLSNISTLIHLDLGKNEFLGLLPAPLGDLRQLRSLVLDANMIDGPIPPKIISMEKLTTLNLADNKLTGSIPDSFENAINLQVLNLSANNLLGQIPPSLCQLVLLNTLMLDNNDLTGTIPACLGDLTRLSTLTVHQNNLEGQVPRSVSQLNATFFGNPRLCLESPINGECIPLSKPGELSIEKSVSECIPGSFVTCHCASSSFNVSMRCLRDGSGFEPCICPENIRWATPDYTTLMIAALCAIILGVLCICLGVTWLFVRNLQSSQDQRDTDKLLEDASSDTGSGMCHNLWKSRPPPPVNLQLRNLPRQSRLGQATMIPVETASGDAFLQPVVQSRRPGVLSFKEISDGTNNFHPANVIGRDSIGKLYRCQLPEGTPGVLKMLEPCGIGRCPEKSFIKDFEALRLLDHPNIVQVLACCTESNHRLIVYEMFTNGSLHERLHCMSWRGGLDWATRVRIALGIAKGLEYLHTVGCVHGDLRSANVIFDGSMGPKLSHYGLSHLYSRGSLELSTRKSAVESSILAPEFAYTQEHTKQTDVYALGLILLEIMSGRKPWDVTQPPEERHLALWARNVLVRDKGWEALADKKLEGRYPLEGFEYMALLAAKCFLTAPEKRPRMREVRERVQMLVDLPKSQICGLKKKEEMTVSIPKLSSVKECMKQLVEMSPETGASLATNQKTLPANKELFLGPNGAPTAVSTTEIIECQDDNVAAAFL